MFNFEEFQEYVQMTLAEHLPEEHKGATISVRDVTKNNGLKLHGIVVLPEGGIVAPTIYLEGYFEHYEKGEPLDSVMEQIAATASAHMNPPEDFEHIAQDFSSFDNVKDRIIMTVVNTQKNEELLSQIPHTEKEDLSLIYKVFFGNDGDGLATIIIRNENMEMWGVTIDEIHEHAMENTKEIFPVTVQSMNEVMRELFSNDGMPDELSEMMLEEMPANQQMYVISNKAKVNGAASMFYEEELSKLAEAMGSDLYVLPSSVHEVIAVSTELGDPESLAEMVQEINVGQVAQEEQLSDHVYRFDAKARSLSLADTTMEKLYAKVSEDAMTYETTQTTSEASRPRHHR